MRIYISESAWQGTWSERWGSRICLQVSTVSSYQGSPLCRFETDVGGRIVALLRKRGKSCIPSSVNQTILEGLVIALGVVHFRY